MALDHVRVFLTPEGKWAVQSDAPGSAATTYCSQGEALAAGVQMAMENEVVLIIYGLDEPPCELDFRDCDARLVA